MDWLLPRFVEQLSTWDQPLLSSSFSTSFLILNLLSFGSYDLFLNSLTLVAYILQWLYNKKSSINKNFEILSVWKCPYSIVNFDDSLAGYEICIKNNFPSEFEGIAPLSSTFQWFCWEVQLNFYHIFSQSYFCFLKKILEFYFFFKFMDAVTFLIF